MNMYPLSTLECLLKCLITYLLEYLIGKRGQCSFPPLKKWAFFKEGTILKENYFSPLIKCNPDNLVDLSILARLLLVFSLETTLFSSKVLNLYKSLCLSPLGTC